MQKQQKLQELNESFAGGKLKNTNTKKKSRKIKTKK